MLIWDEVACYWTANRDWYGWDENGNYYIKRYAPRKAKESYRLYLKQKKFFETDSLKLLAQYEPIDLTELE